MKFSLLESYRNEMIASAEEYNRELADNFKRFQEEIAKISSKAHYDKLHNALKRFVDVYNEHLCKEVMAKLIERWLDSGAAFRDYSDAFMMGDMAKDAAYLLESRVADAWLQNNELNLFEDIAFEGEPKAERGDFEQAKDCFAKYKEILEKTTEWYLGHLQYRREENEFFMAMTPVVAGFGAAAAAFVEAGCVWINELEEEYLAMMAHNRGVTENVYKNGKLSGNVSTENAGMSSNSGMPAIDGGIAAGAAVGAVAAGGGNSSQNQYQDIIKALQNFKEQSCVHCKRSTECEKKRQDVWNKINQNFIHKRNQLLHKVGNYHNTLEMQLRAELKKLDSPLNFMASREQKQQERWRLCQEADRQYAQKCNEFQLEFDNLKKWAESLYHSQKQFLVDTWNNSQAQLVHCRELALNKKRFIESLKDGVNATSTLEEIRQLLVKADDVCVDKCPMFAQLCAAMNITCGPVKNSQLQLSDYVDKSLQKAAHLKNEKLLKYPLRTDNMTWEENLKVINPKRQQSLANDDRKYTHNCQRCIIAYEARCRGFDVAAAARKYTKDAKGDWVSAEVLANRDSPNGYPNVFKDGYNKLEYLGGATVQEAVERIKKRMQHYGDGARAFVAYQRVNKATRKNEGGHVFIVEQRNGQTVFCDPQTASTNAIYNFNCKPIKNFGCVNCGKSCLKFKMINGKLEMANDKLYTGCRSCVCGTKNAAGTVECTVLDILSICILRMDNLEFTDLAHQCFEPVQKGATK